MGAAHTMVAGLDMPHLDHLGDHVALLVSVRPSTLAAVAGSLRKQQAAHTVLDTSKRGNLRVHVSLVGTMVVVQVDKVGEYRTLCNKKSIEVNM